MRASAIASDADNVVQARLVDGGVLRVPAADTGLVTVDDDNLEVRVLEGNNSGSGTTLNKSVMIRRKKVGKLRGFWGKGNTTKMGEGTYQRNQHQRSKSCGRCTR